MTEEFDFNQIQTRTRSSEQVGPPPKSNITLPVREPLHHFLPYKSVENLSTGSKLIPNMKDYEILNLVSQDPKGNKSSSREVWTAHHKTNQKTLIITEINKSLTKPEIVINEIEILARLRPKCRKYVICYETSFETDHYYYILSEFLGNYVTLDQFLPKFPHLHLSDQIKLVNHLIQGLHYIHNQDIVYRNLTSQSLMIDPINCNIKYIDVGSGCQNTPCHNSNFIKNMNYMAPEEFRHRGKNFTMEDRKQIDIWALGIIIYELINGQVPLLLWLSETHQDLSPEAQNLTFVLNWEFPTSSNQLGKADQKFVEFAARYKEKFPHVDLMNTLETDPKQRLKF